MKPHRDHTMEVSIFGMVPLLEEIVGTWGKGLYHVLLILIKAPSNHPIPDSCGNPDPRWCPQSEVGL